MSRAHDPAPAASPDWWWVFDPRISLRARTALVVGGGTLLLVLGLSWVAGNIFRRHVQEHFGVAFESLAFQVSDRLDRQFYERFATLQLASTLPVLREGKVAIADQRRALETVLQAQPDFAWLGFADTTGNVTSATQRIFEGTHVADAPWFIVGAQKFYAGRVRAIPALAQLGFDAEEAPRFIDLAVPVTTPEGRLLGVLGAAVRMPLTREIQPTVIPEVARREHLGVTVYGAAGGLLLDSGGSGWSDPPVAPGVRETEMRGYLVEKTGLGTTYFTGFTRARGYREFPGLGWLVTVRQPVQDAFAPAVRLQREIIGWGAALAVGVITLSWWFAGRLVKRMAVVENAAKLIRQGDVLTVLPHPTGDGEMDRMCAALDDLVEDLRVKHVKPADPPPASERHPW